MRGIWTLAFLSGCFVSEIELDRALDRDGDGVLPPQVGGPDCDESRADVNPNVAELCGDGVDNDCDGRVDDDGVGARTWYLDADDDGYGTDASVTACTQPPGYAAVPGDCDDEDQAYNPGALDLCDGLDQDCDGLADNDDVLTVWYRDHDDDGWGDELVTTVACIANDGWVTRAQDCDDGDPTTNPSARDDQCDGFDQDCSGTPDDDAPLARFYVDDDGDGWGDALQPSVEVPCGAPAGYAPLLGDCDDLDEGVHPEAADGCDGIDQDCDGAFDEDAPFAVWFRDADGDGLGDAMDFVATCDGPPAGFLPFAGDCDDSNSAVTMPTWYADADGDGFGVGDPVPRCEAPADHTARPGDCDDTQGSVNPDASDVCDNGRDDDCDPSTSCRWSGELSEADGMVIPLPNGSTGARFIGNFLGGPEVELAVTHTSIDVYAGPIGGALGAPSMNLLGTQLLGRPLDITGDGLTEVTTRTFGRGSIYGVDGQHILLLTRPAGGLPWLADGITPVFWASLNQGNGRVRSYAFASGDVGDNNFITSVNGTEASQVGASSVDLATGSAGDVLWLAELPSPGSRAYGFIAPAAGVHSVDDADFVVDSAPENTELRIQVADIDGDGFDDLVMSGTDRGNGLMEGFATVAFGPLDLNPPTLDGSWQLHGQPGRMDVIEPVGDLDGDGLVDFASFVDASGAGHTLIPIWFGGAGERGIGDADAFVVNTHPTAAIHSFAGQADVDGDGVDDLGFVRIDPLTGDADLVILHGIGD